MNSMTWLFTGAALGLLASVVIHRRNSMWLLNVIVGMVAAFAAGHLLPPVFRVAKLNPAYISLPALLISMGAAVFLPAVFNFVRREIDIKNEVIERQWGQLRDKIQARWAKLSKEDVVKIDGNHSRLIGAIQSSYGCANKEAEDQIQRFLWSVLVDTGHTLVYDRVQVADHLPGRRQ